MADKPGYDIARKKRATIKDWHPEPHNEVLDPADKSGRTTQGGVGEIPSIQPAIKNKAVPAPVHPGDFSRPDYSPVTTT